MSNGKLDKASAMSSGSDSSEEGNVERGNWSRKLDFVLSCLSYAVGLGNVWRFPYVCYRNGAGAFLIPFLIMLFITGIPLVFMELSLGQYASTGVVGVWKAAPLFQGVGWAMFVVSVFICIYYNMIIAYTLYYLFASLAANLPWAECGEWATEACSTDIKVKMLKCQRYNNTWCDNQCVNSTAVDFSSMNCTIYNGTTKLKSPSDDYFHHSVLSITGGIYSLGDIKWELAGCLAFAWVLVCICLAKGIKTSGKAVYFTAFFPYVVLLILLIRGLTLPGSLNGIVYYVTPQWEKLGRAKVWGDAAVQIFFSLSPCWGGLITLASYNKFHNNSMKDAIIVSVLDCVTSVFAGLVIFSIIGYMAEVLEQDIEDVATEGAGLAFVAYPDVVTKLPLSQLWSVLFFAMLITLGLGTQIATVTTVHTTLLDQFPNLRKGYRKTVLLIIIAIVCFLIGLIFCSQGGMYMLQLFDNYAATYSLLFIGMVECIGIAWVYGADRFLSDVELMLGHRPSVIWKYSWKFVAPIALLAILLFTAIDFNPTEYNKQPFPGWADGLGSLITISSIIMIPIVAVYLILKEKGSFGGSIFDLIKYLTKPTENWGPYLKEHRAQRQMMGDGFIHDAQIPLKEKA
ncbi:sodium- and chloride-dependent glycine transporter 2-like [Ostrea edulis]|uniref:sodium- and chloride-dependent glycine transporter 2-like n=1 Tax=Ostrea edulis TaxID=37623 RepID=UPI002095F04E|nr:sodium- and chloride-dependent glycine transporter 2-like [Ostrea edulis]XP_048778054.1 sodium- and chloride-dependent glycine transporter 2-like [Ostrea edulis]XP_048778055.1 sodium- and chloride-dependent glycine transporter 2-like [Ostrea edulis]